MKQQRVTIFGAGGFLGRYVVQRLAKQGCRVRAQVRDTEAASFLKTLGNPGQITIERTDVRDPQAVSRAVAGADTVINAAGSMYERGDNTFDAVHSEGAENVARAAAEAGASNLVQVSSISARADSKSRYARAKAAGEERVLAAFAGAVLLRPAMLIGPEDHFMNTMAKLARFSPVLPVVGCPVMPRIKMVSGPSAQWRIPVLELCSMGGASFQPVYVGDVADAVIRVIGDASARGKTFELTGPTTYTLHQLLELLLREIGRSRMIVPAPIPMALTQAFFLEMIPGCTISRDQVWLLTEGNMASGARPGFKELNIKPTAIEVVLPTYLRSFRPPARQRLREV